jgi:hypothetical protein
LLLLLDGRLNASETALGIIPGFTVSAVSNLVGRLCSGNRFNIDGLSYNARGKDRLANVLGVVIDELVTQLGVAVLTSAAHHNLVRQELGGNNFVGVALIGNILEPTEGVESFV